MVLIVYICLCVRDKVKNKWYLLEGSVCEVEKIMEKTEIKLEKFIELRAGIKDKYKECEKAQFFSEDTT